MKDYARQFYNSKQWERTRKAYAQSVDGLCERCIRKGIYVPGKIVHHKTYLTESNIRNESISLSFDNLELLCQDCHNAEHHRVNDTRYKFDEYGNIIITGE